MERTIINMSYKNVESMSLLVFSSPVSLYLLPLIVWVQGLGLLIKGFIALLQSFRRALSSVFTAFLYKCSFHSIIA